MQTMQAVVFDGELKYVRDWPVPRVKPGWAWSSQLSMSTAVR